MIICLELFVLMFQCYLSLFFFLFLCLTFINNCNLISKKSNKFKCKIENLHNCKTWLFVFLFLYVLKCEFIFGTKLAQLQITTNNNNNYYNYYYTTNTTEKTPNYSQIQLEHYFLIIFRNSNSTSIILMLCLALFTLNVL